MKKEKLFDIVLIASANFKDIGHSKLNVHIISEELSKNGHKILFVESLGLKNIPLNTSIDLKKVLLRLKLFLLSWFRGPLRVNENLYVISPVRLPMEKISMIKKINEFIIFLYIKRYMYLINRPFLLWLFLPTQSYLIKKLNPDLSAYYAVDDYTEVPGVDKEFILKSEKLTVEQVDKVFTTAQSVANRLQKYFKKGSIKVLPNVARVSHFKRALDSDCYEPEDLKKLRDPKYPLAIFYGNLAGYKLDLNLLFDICSKNPDIQFFLIGAVGLGDKKTPAIEKLKKLPNVALPGPRPYEELPCYLRFADIAFLVQKQGNVSLGGFPMKYFEYVSAGLPVLTTDQKQLYPHIKDEKLGSIYHDAKSFREAVFYWKKLKSSPENIQLIKYRLNYVKDYSWEKRIAFFEKEFSKALKHAIIK